MSEGSTTKREAVYDAEIHPLMAKIIDICKANGIPVVASFDISGPEDDGLHCTTLTGVTWEEMPEKFKRAKAVLIEQPQAFAFTIMTKGAAE
jgi:hypothetical protein